MTSLLTSFYGHAAPRRLRRAADGLRLPLLTSFDDRWARIDGAIVPRFRRHEGRGDALPRALAVIIADAQGGVR